jgi:hypothetical protein
LEVFEATDNSLSDLIELEMCSSIKRLNLKNNLIENEENIQFLSSLLDLRWLNLNGNPIKDMDSYKEQIKLNLPDLEILDNDEDTSYLIFESEKDLEINSNMNIDQSNSTLCSSSVITDNNSKQPFTSTNFFKISDQDFSKTEKNFSKKNRDHEQEDNEFIQSKDSNSILRTNMFIDNEEIDNDNNLKLSLSPPKQKRNKSTTFRVVETKNNNKLTNKNLFNQPIVTGQQNLGPAILRPIMAKKQINTNTYNNMNANANELKAFKNSIDVELASEIIKNIDKNKGSAIGVKSLNTNRLSIKDSLKSTNTFKNTFLNPVNILLICY